MGRNADALRELAALDNVTRANFDGAVGQQVIARPSSQRVALAVSITDPDLLVTGVGAPIGYLDNGVFVCLVTLTQGTPSAVLHIDTYGPAVQRAIVSDATGIAFQLGVTSVDLIY